MGFGASSSQITESILSDDTPFPGADIPQILTNTQTIETSTTTIESDVSTVQSTVITVEGQTSAIEAQVAKLDGVAPSKGSTTANWQTAAAVVCTIGAVGVRNKVHSAIIDISALVGNITAAMFISVNGNQRQVFPPKAGTTFNVTNGDAPGLALINGTFGIANILTIEVQSDNVADNGAAIGFEFMLEAM
jgi:hypothetical protein